MTIVPTLLAENGGYSSRCSAHETKEEEMIVAGNEKARNLNETAGFSWLLRA